MKINVFLFMSGPSVLHGGLWNWHIKFVLYGVPDPRHAVRDLGPVGVCRHDVEARYVLVTVTGYAIRLGMEIDI